MRPRHSTLQLFLDRICPEPTSGCWLWIGRVEKHGYGKFCDYRGVWWAHRASYELFVGTIPAGLQIDHKCRVRCCVNPRHLRVVTPKENMVGHPGRKISTVCPKGHPMSGKNAMADRRGTRRRCRACHYAYTYAHRSASRGTRRAHD